MAGSQVAVVGSGAWGTTLAILATNAGSETRLVVRSNAEAVTIRAERTNERYLPGIDIPAGLQITADLPEAIEHADIVILAVPSQTMRANAAILRPLIRNAIVVSAAKGLEHSSLSRMSEVIAVELPTVRICAISGPNLAREITQGKPATTVIAGYDLDAVNKVRGSLMSPTFRCYANEDIVGVEMGGALKNIIAIGAGMADGLAAGDNAKAAFITRGMAEITRLGVAAGADPFTFAGLSGLGDLMATCASNLSRNYRVGRELALGRSVADIRATLGSVAEGVDTTAVAAELGAKLGVELPIIESLNRVLFGALSVTDAISALMGRDATHELGELRAMIAERAARPNASSGH